MYCHFAVTDHLHAVAIEPLQFSCHFVVKWDYKAGWYFNFKKIAN